jgi:hypothetical protein
VPTASPQHFAALDASKQVLTHRWSRHWYNS